MGLAAAIFWCWLPATANAAWYEASSKHFVIYSNQNQNELVRYATRLEQFDLAVRVLRSMDNPPIAPSARLTVFVLKDEDAVQALADARGSTLAGFYIARSSGSLAVVPKKTVADGSGFSSQVVFFHEYAHHLMAEGGNLAVPRWFGEGFAEFFSTAQFERGGSILIGTSPAHRSYGVFAQTGISYSDLLSGTYSEKMTVGQVESLYGRGWALVHYLTFAPERKGQLSAYLSKLGGGASSKTAAEQAFGDLRQLEKDIQRYASKSRLAAVRVALDPAAVGEIRFRQLQPGEAAILPTRIRSKVGVNKKTAPAVLAQAKQIAQQYPNDTLVAISLAEASLDAGDVEGAVAAANHAAELNPQSVEAKLFRGRSLLARAEKSSNGAADIKSARAAFMAANKIEPEHPEPLRAFYESYFTAREMPSKNATEALHYAAALAPADRNLSWLSAQQHLIDKEPAKARAQLVLMAYDPHGGALSDHARNVIDLIDAGKLDDALALFQGGGDEKADANSSH